MLTIQPGYEITPDGTAYDVFFKTDAPVVVLIHGLGLCRHMWRDHIAYFAADYHVVSYDLLGHGDSAAPTAPKSAKAPSTRLVSCRLMSLP